MSDADQDIREALKQSLPASSVAQPPFEQIWRAAQAQHAAAHGQFRRFAVAAAAVVAVLLIGVSLQQAGNDDTPYIELAELLNSTSWSAPSDVLLPQHEFDIYQDLPTLIEST